MEIVRRLSIRGINNAVLIKDAEATYPVFMTSLHVADIFSGLVSSGYKLIGLPFEFSKDGMSIQSLPVEDYTPTPQEEQDMFDIDCAKKLSTDELLTKISTEDVKYMDIPGTNYKITTRADFLTYLRSLEVGSLEEAPIPINSFVHPSALFTVEEMLSGEYREYFHIMEHRRRMSYLTYLKLCDWLRQYFPNVDRSHGDFLEAYYAWGIEGVNLRFISVRRKVVYIAMNAVAGATLDGCMLHYNDLAAVDRYGAVIPPKGIPIGSLQWKISYPGGREDQLFRNKISRLSEGEYDVVEISTNCDQEILEMSGLKYTATVTPYNVTVGRFTMSNFSITTYDASPTSLNYIWWSSAYSTRVHDMSTLRAVAYDIVKQRKRVNPDATSFKLLTSIGFDIKGALNYILQRLPKDSEDAEADASVPTEHDVELYVQGSVDKDDYDAETVQRFEFLDMCVNGEQNVDSIANGQMVDSMVDVWEVYRYLAVARFCLDVPVKDFIELAKDVDRKVQNVTDARGVSDVKLPMHVGNGFTVNIPCPVMDSQVKGYSEDRLRYKLMMAEQCTVFGKVVQVAREWGTREANRHVAFEMQCVKLVSGNNVTQASRNLDRILSVYVKATEALPGHQREKYLRAKNTFCMLEYFHIAEDGWMNLPKVMGGRHDFDASFSLSCKSTIRNEITSTTAYCERMLYGGMFTHYCVNADITPFQIYPIGTAVIPEAHIFALWSDLAGIGNAAIMQKLIVEGSIYPGFYPWTYRYYDNKHFSDLTDLVPEVNLGEYVDYCGRFNGSVTPTEAFVHVPHMQTLQYKYYPDETVKVDMGTKQRDTSVPPILASYGRTLTKDLYPIHGKVEAKLPGEDMHVKPFTGYALGDFNMIDLRAVNLPSVGDVGKYFIVNGESISTDTTDDLPYYAVEQYIGIGYPIVRLWGRRYVLRDCYGKLWEVTV